MEILKKIGITAVAVIVGLALYDFLIADAVADAKAKAKSK